MNFALQFRLRRPLFNASFYFLFAMLAVAAIHGGWRVHGQMGTVTTVSAASYAPGGAVAPDSIVAAFGAKLATGTALATTLPLPTTLGGTTVRVNGQLAPLFFVSPGQVNYVIPSGVAAGAATVVVNVGDGSVSQGTVQIATAAPGVFTANANGIGVLAAVAIRVAANGAQTIEAVAQAGGGRQVPRPIDLGPEGERVFLSLFLTGVRGVPDPNGDNNVRENVRIVIGGIELQPDYAGRQGTLAGLDQLNVEIPRSLIGRGRVNLAVTATGAVASNLTEIEIGPRPGASPPQVNNYNPANVLVRNDVTITGSGFSSNAGENLVRIGGVEATINSASPTQLSVRAPWGVIGGPVTVRTGQGEGASSNAVAVRTSISGLLEDTSSQPITGALVKVRNTSIASSSATDGTFILPDIPFTGLALVDIDPNTPGGLPYPVVTVRRDVLSNRDNEIERTNPLEAATGPSMTVGTGSGFASDEESDQAEPAAPDAPTATITTDGVVLEVSGAATALFPDGARQGQITLTSVRNSRTPVNLPPGVFSSTIVQITPFRVRLAPGGMLTFPNRDGLPADSTARLYKFDQTANSPTIGSFIDVGAATVSANGQFIQTATGAIQETSYYFVGVPRQTTTVVGRVVESNSVTPVRRGRANLRGQEAFTDGNGGFILRQVPAGVGEMLSVAATVIRSIGRVDRGQSRAVPAVIGGVTNVGDIVLPAVQSNQPPDLAGIPASLTVTENIESRFEFQVLDPNPNQTVRVTVGGANFVSLLPAAPPEPYAMVLAPKLGTAGRYTITVMATDSLGLARSISFPLRVNRPPVANAQTVNVERDKPQTITLAGSDPDQDPINFLVATSPKNGTLSGGPPALTYTPNPGFAGTDEFMFKANDGFADSPNARVVIVVQPPSNSPPTITVPGAQTATAGSTVTFTVTGTDPDAGQVLTITTSSLPAGATFTTTGQNPIVGTFSWKTPAGALVNATVTFTVTDNGNPKLSDSKSVSIRTTQPGVIMGVGTRG